MKTAPEIKLMGIVNVTPDSFSDGGLFANTDDAVDQALRLIADGADILDIGGESTRPYSTTVSVDEELSRIVPVITGIRTFSDIPVSIDTMKAEVAREALLAGATIINDVSALRHDPAMMDLVRDTDVTLIIMHMKGTPGTMQDNPEYEDVVEEIISFFQERLTMLASEEIDLKRVVIDPGIGFGKTLNHNLLILRHFEKLSSLGQPVLLGHSRKRFLGEITGIATADRDLVTAVVSSLCREKKVSIMRVHDVAATRSALQVSQAISQVH
ncbi:MAG: dihydropteroate synthase [Desulfocapsaceae bacterium]|jgi:dihydropteroate synthase|nr:dihydropteroate synthase [Desulfocapsaceae bacterium]